MVIDDMAWAIANYGDGQLHERLLVRASWNKASVIEEGLNQGLFRKERADRHAYQDDADMKDEI